MVELETTLQILVCTPIQQRRFPILLNTLLNKVHKFKSFVYKKVCFNKDSSAIIAHVEPRANSKPVCSSCFCKGSVYDHQSVRLFEFIPIWNIPVFISYKMRRVDCKACGVKIELVPWADGKHSCCNAYRHYLASWAKKMSWAETAKSFKTSWDNVCRSVKWVVDYGLKHRDLSGVEALGVDEVAYSKGHNYMTLVYQIDGKSKRLLGVLKDRKEEVLRSFFEELGEKWRSKIKVVCSDMWKPYLNVIKNTLPNALNILDRFHIVKKLNEAVDQVRKDEVKKMHSEGYEPILKKSKYCFLKRPENLTPNQRVKLNEVLEYSLKSTRAYMLKESFDAFWQYSSPYWAHWYLKKWCTRTMRSRLDPMKKFVRTLRNHEDLIMNYFRTKKRYSSGIVEGLNRRINLSMRKAYGYKSFDLLKVSLFHQLGDLPEPEFTHRFC